MNIYVKKLFAHIYICYLWLAKQLDRDAGPTDDMKYLAGLTRIQYVFFYP
mgnify:CR=1 FL=1